MSRGIPGNVKARKSPGENAGRRIPGLHARRIFEERREFRRENRLRKGLLGAPRPRAGRPCGRRRCSPRTGPTSAAAARRLAPPPPPPA
eukprot:492000-Prorocentrum_minimum.AAC.2